MSFHKFRRHKPKYFSNDDVIHEWDQNTERMTKEIVDKQAMIDDYDGSDLKSMIARTNCIPLLNDNKMSYGDTTLIKNLQEARRAVDSFVDIQNQLEYIEEQQALENKNNEEVKDNVPPKSENQDPTSGDK